MLELGEVFDEYPNPLFVVRPIVENGRSDDFTYMYVNKAFANFIGKSVGELVGNSFAAVFGEGLAEEQWVSSFYESAVNKKYLNVDNESPIIGKKLYTEIFHVAPDMCGCIIKDYAWISENLLLVTKEEHNRLEKAKQDPLTGLYNRTYLKEIENSIYAENGVGIVYLDLNNLKDTNDTFGHEVGDKLLCEFADLICDLFIRGTVFRIGGDEFLVICTGMEKREFASKVDYANRVFKENKMAAMGSKYFDKIENFADAIKECDALMYEQKKTMK